MRPSAMVRIAAFCLLTGGLAACGADKVYAPDEQVAAARYVSEDAPSITLFTVIQKRGGGGAHSGLMINGSQRVMYDPAGTWNHPWVPERYDLHYGITDKMRAFYIDYHARETYDVLEQKIYVSPEAAEAAIRRAAAQGATPKAMCTSANSAILRDVPGFEGMPQTFYPMKLSEAFGKLPGVTSKLHHDGDPDNNSGVLLVQKGQLPK